MAGSSSEDAMVVILKYADLCQKTGLGTRTGKEETRLNRTKALCQIMWKGKLGDRIGLRLPHQTKDDHWKGKGVPTAGKGQHQKSII